MSKSLTAADLCTRDTVVAKPSLALTDAARLMREHHVGSLVVVDETPAGQVPVGLLTDRDIVTAVVAKDVEARLLSVEDVMNASPVTVREQDSVLDVLTAMRAAGVRRVVVTNADDLLQGVLALDDLLEVVSEQLQAIVQALASGRQREPQRRP